MVSATSNNTVLVPDPIVTYTSPSATGQLQYTPATDRSGSAVINVTVRDAGPDGTFNNTDDATVSRSFTVNVTPLNGRHASIPIADPAPILEDADQQFFNLTNIAAGPFESQTLTLHRGF